MELSEKERAQITVILIRLINELAGGEKAIDERVAAAIEDIIDLCCRSQLKSTPEMGRPLFFEAVELIDQKDWLLTVKKIGDVFQFEAKFGRDLETAKTLQVHSLGVRSRRQLTPKTNPNALHIVADHPLAPPLTISQADVDEAYGDPSVGRSPMFYIDSDWNRKFERFFQEHIVWVKSNNVLLLRFQYTYEVDLDRIKTERDLLAWTRHLVSKPWMGPERTQAFIDTVADIKGFNLTL